MKTRILLFYFFLIVIGATAQTKNDSIVQQLEEVSVTSKVKIITNKNGNVKIDVANSIYNSVPNAVDLLAKLPKIQVSPDRENITIIGKGNPLIYIDNQKVGVNDLNTLSVDDIKNIEMINNPSAKYEADGRAVILISRKRSRKEGLKIDVSETASFKKKFNNYSGISSSLNHKKTEFKANFNFNSLNPWESNGINYEIPTADIVANYRVGGFTKRKQYIIGAGIFHQINDDDCISFNVNTQIQSDNFRFSTQTFNKQNGLGNTIETLGNNEDQRHFFNAFVNYNKKIKGNRSFFTGLQFSNYRQESEIKSFNNYNQTQLVPFQHREQDFEIRYFSGRADFDKKFVNEMKFAAGVLFAGADANTGFEMTDFEQQQFTNSQYRLSEKNSSVYSELSGILKKISWIAGIRAENTNIKGKYHSETKALIDKNYTNLFPKIQIEIPVDSSKTFLFNYSKTIARPDFSSTSQGATYINPYFVFASNINLDPAVNDEISATFQYKDKSVKAFYYQNKNATYYSFTFDNQQNLLTFRPENFKKESGYAVEFMLPFAHSIWNSTTVLNFYLNKIEDPKAILFGTEPFIYYYSNHIFAFKNNCTVSVTGSGMTKRKEGIYDRNDFFILDLAASKTFFKSLSCTLSLNNILKDVTYKENFSISQVNAKAQYFSNTREISLALKYTFGKVKEKIQTEKSIEETSRIR